MRLCRYATTRLNGFHALPRIRSYASHALRPSHGPCMRKSHFIRDSDYEKRSWRSTRAAAWWACGAASRRSAPSFWKNWSAVPRCLRTRTAGGWTSGVCFFFRQTFRDPAFRLSTRGVAIPVCDACAQKLVGHFATEFRYHHHPSRPSEPLQPRAVFGKTHLTFKHI